MHDLGTGNKKTYVSFSIYSGPAASVDFFPDPDPYPACEPSSPQPRAYDLVNEMF